VFFRPITEKSYCTGDRLVVKTHYSAAMKTKIAGEGRRNDM